MFRPTPSPARLAVLARGVFSLALCACSSDGETTASDAGPGGTGGTGGSTGGHIGGSTGGSTGGNSGGSTGGNIGGSTGGNTGGSTGGDTGGNTGGTGGSTGGNTGGTGGATGGDPQAPPEGAALPLGACGGPHGGSLAGPELPRCDVRPGPPCEAPCDLVDPVEVRCDRRVGTWFGLRSDDTPWIVADPAAVGQSPVAFTLGTPPVETPLVGVPVTRGYGLDAGDTLHVLHTTEGPDAALLHRTAGGADSPVTCLEGLYTVFTPFSLVGAPGQPGALSALVGAIHGEQQGLAVLTRAAGGEWAAEDLRVAASHGQLAVAADGTPLVTILTTETGSFGVWLRGAAGWHRLPLDLGHLLEHSPVLVPGASDAAFVMAAAGPAIRFATPDAAVDFGVPGLGLLDTTPDCVGQENECDRICTTQAEGSTRLPVVLPDGAGALLVHVRATLDVESHDEGEPCSEAGCFCEHVVDADRSTFALVVERFDPAARTLREAWRMPVADASVRVEAARTRSGDLVLAWPDETGVRLARLPAARLAP